MPEQKACGLWRYSQRCFLRYVQRPDQSQCSSVGTAKRSGTLRYRVQFKPLVQVCFSIPREMQDFIAGSLRRPYWAAQGIRIGKGIVLPKRVVTWPHQVAIGKNCRIETGVYFHCDGICLPGPSIVLGNDCFIGSGCEFNISVRITVEDRCLIANGTGFIDHDHAIPYRSDFVSSAFALS